MTIDAHQHFWKYNAVKHSWITDEMKVIQKDFLPADLQKIYTANKVDGCIAVQADESDDETLFLLDLAEKNDFIKGVAGWVDVKAVNLDEQLHAARKNIKLKGFRSIIQGRPDDLYFTNLAFRNGMKLIGRYGFRFDILVYYDQMASANKFMDQYPDQHFILDHLGKPAIKHKEIKKWKEQIRIMAQHPLTYCKLSGLITEADWKQWQYDDLAPYLEIAAEYFGVSRLCFGSDWPVCLLAGNYGEVMGILTKFLGQVNDEERKQVMGLNALAFYQ